MEDYQALASLGYMRRPFLKTESLGNKLTLLTNGSSSEGFHFLWLVLSKGNSRVRHSGSRR